MGAINIPRDEQDALAAIDIGKLYNLVDQALRDERTAELQRLPLTRCGSYVSGQLHRFEQALARHRLAKSAKKREQTEYDLRKAGGDLTFAVRARLIIRVWRCGGSFA